MVGGLKDGGADDAGADLVEVLQPYAQQKVHTEKIML